MSSRISKEHSSEIVAEMVKQMGKKVTKGDNPNQKKTIEWLESDLNCHPFVLLAVPDMKVCELSLLHLVDLRIWHCYVCSTSDI
jgi:hypothetical protein